MIPIITLLMVLTISLLVTRIATVALTFTGLSRESARFQARSAFTGVGFTTSESEHVVNHPVRRRILMVLMLFGNAGIVTVIASLMLTVVDIEVAGASRWRMLWVIAAVIAFWALAANRWVDRQLSRLISKALERYTKLDVKDYADLLHVAGDYKVTELNIDPRDWIANKTLEELRLQDEGIMILGVTRDDGKYIGAPHGTTKLLPHDSLILYGRSTSLSKLDQREQGSMGDREHREAVREQTKILEEQKNAADVQEDAEGPLH